MRENQHRIFLNPEKSDNPRAPQFTGRGQLGRKDVKAALWVNDDGTLALSLSNGTERRRVELRLNERRTSEKSPDYYSYISFGGTKYRIVGWAGENRYGEYVSLVFEPVEETQQNRAATSVETKRRSLLPRSPLSETREEGGDGNGDDEDVPF